MCESGNQGLSTWKCRQLKQQRSKSSYLQKQRPQRRPETEKEVTEGRLEKRRQVLGRRPRSGQSSLVPGTQVWGSSSEGEQFPAELRISCTQRFVVCAGSEHFPGVRVSP